MSLYRAMRRRILTPSVAETRMDVRGFHVKSDAGRELLETVGASFLAGYAYAAEARTGRDAEPRLEQVPTRFRGFAYEGAAMALAVREGLPIGRKTLVAEFLSGRGDDHVYMAYVGVGWAMARLPRFRWGTLHAPDPLLRWLVLDGYGFHQAYFRTEKYVGRHFQEVDFPWPAGPAGGQFQWYANHAIDQGIGRAMWFVGGTDPEEVVRLINRFPAERHADLYAGAGLAATYAGGVDETELRRFWELGAHFRPQIAQGAAFAAGARARAGLTVPHNELATQIFCGTSVDAARKVTDEALVGLTDSGRVPAWEVWRRRISAAFAAHITA
ncbi:MAG: DUF1702 family protein [Hamadaea sp.]|nr:DUF1702 family protein [Hamadaea sp.]NUT08741.1 DUF1702 family protein [Hamadaea sp.]